MMYVYVASMWDLDGSQIVGVYYTRQSALDALKRVQPSFPDHTATVDKFVVGAAPLSPEAV